MGQTAVTPLPEKICQCDFGIDNAVVHGFAKTEGGNHHEQQRMRCLVVLGCLQLSQKCSVFYVLAEIKYFIKVK